MILACWVPTTDVAEGVKNPLIIENSVSGDQLINDETYHGIIHRRATGN